MPHATYVFQDDRVSQGGKRLNQRILEVRDLY